MNLAIFTSAITGRPVAVDPELIGEARDISSSAEMGMTRLVSKKSRRVVWRVTEPFGVVLDRLDSAKDSTQRGPGPSDSQIAVERGTAAGHPDLSRDPAGRTFALMVDRAAQLPAGSAMTISSSLVLWLAQRMLAADPRQDRPNNKAGGDGATGEQTYCGCTEPARRIRRRRDRGAGITSRSQPARAADVNEANPTAPQRARKDSQHGKDATETNSRRG